MELPKHILNATENNQTSIGNNPCLPPDEEVTFMTTLLKRYFNKITKNLDNINQEHLTNDLSKLISNAIKIEKDNKEALEKICVETVINLFKIPDETIIIDCKLVNTVDTSNQRYLPEETVGFNFENIDELYHLTDEINKRRVLNALILGASMYCVKNYKTYFNNIFEVSDELPSLYKKIITLNEILMYLVKDTINNNDNQDGGKVDVIMTSQENLIKIISEGVIFPILLSETIRGILEIAISHGLPEDGNKANYILSKADFKFVEIWDMRIGCPLWENIVDLVNQCGFDIYEIGINFLLMCFATMSVEEFNNNMKEIFAKTKKGKDIIENIIKTILKNKKEDEFNDYITTKNSDNVIINDDEYFSADDLILDSTNI